jgi:Holliday junction resolvasome RuvABC endonuclease subunit
MKAPLKAPQGPEGGFSSFKGLRTLALDLSTTSTGWAIGNGSPEAWGTIKPPAKAGVIERIAFVVDESLKLFRDFAIEAVAIEESNYARNMKVARALLGLRGALVLEFWRASGKEPAAFHRLSILKALGLKAADGKEGVIRLLAAQGYNAETEDEADAIAVLLYAFRPR